MIQSVYSNTDIKKTYFCMFAFQIVDNIFVYKFSSRGLNENNCFFQRLKMEDADMHKVTSKISEFRLQMQAEEFERNRRRNMEGM